MPMIHYAECDWCGEKEEADTAAGVPLSPMSWKRYDYLLFCSDECVYKYLKQKLEAPDI